MAPHRRPVILTALSLLVAVAMLAGCGATATPTAAPTSAPTAATTTPPTAVPPTKAPATATSVPPTATPQGPTVGGKMVISFGTDADTMDFRYATGAGNILPFLGATLLSKNFKTGELTPYLAQSWTLSPDGLTYEFKLRKDVKFHNGAPFTAKDYVWTFQSIQDPNNKSPLAAPYAGLIFEAPDDYTLRIKLAAPNPYFLVNGGWWFSAQPLSKAYFDQVGNAGMAKQPVGVGPFKFKEWVTGDHVTMERNPDFTWGPPFTHGGAPYIQTLEFKFIAETATSMAGIEAGELDYVPVLGIAPGRLATLPNVDIVILPPVGTGYVLLMNQSRAPFDDIRVRQAFNMIVDKETLVKVAAVTKGVVSTMPLTPATVGYCKDVEPLGYKFDLAKAKSLLAEAGFTPGSDGMLQKDGKPLALKLITAPTLAKICTTLVEQFKAAGVKVEMQQSELGVWYAESSKGNFDLDVSQFQISDASILPYLFSSTPIGFMNWGKTKDPQLDAMLGAISVATDAKAAQPAVCQALTRIVQQAYTVPLYGDSVWTAVSKRIKGLSVGDSAVYLQLFDAYIAK